MSISTPWRGYAPVLAPTARKQLIDQLLPLLPDPEQVHGRTAPREQLTPREHEVFLLIAAGRSHREIAADPHLSEGTVKNHVGHILAKFSLRDRVQAVVLAYESGLIAPTG